MAENQKGLYGKYIIQKADGSPVDFDAKYFVLRYDGSTAWAKICRWTLWKMIDNLLKHDRYPELAKELGDDLTRESLICDYGKGAVEELK